MEWRRLNAEEADRLRGRRVLIVRADGVGYYGVLRYTSPGFLELELRFGGVQHVSYDAHVWNIVEVIPPAAPTPKMGHPRFDWSTK